MKHRKLSLLNRTLRDMIYFENYFVIKKKILFLVKLLFLNYDEVNSFAL